MYSSHDAVKTGWLAEAERMGHLVGKTSEALLVLASKRATLEEKMIARELTTISLLLSSLLRRIFSMLIENAEMDFADAYGALRECNLKIEESLDEFLKIARYDLNFLEQYFEHGFCKRLLEDQRFADVLSWVEIRFGDTGSSKAG